jgi:hypothetical protein
MGRHLEVVVDAAGDSEPRLIHRHQPTSHFVEFMRRPGLVDVAGQQVDQCIVKSCGCRAIE